MVGVNNSYAKIRGKAHFINKQLKNLGHYIRGFVLDFITYSNFLSLK
jgi:hypothetical protein